MYTPTFPEYSLGIGSIITINPYTHVYEVSPIPLLELDDDNRTGILSKIEAVPLGNRGNTLEGVQSQESYEIGDTVVYLHQTSGDNVTTLGYILGVISLGLIPYTGEGSQVGATTWDDRNLGFTNFHKFEDWEQTGGKTFATTSLGHTGIDMLPGSYERVGKLVAFQFSDYYVALRATCAEILINGMERRLVLQSMLRTESTVNSADDICIVDQSTITSHKECGNVKDAWYNCLTEDDELIQPIKPAVLPKYRIIVQTGDILYGEHKTLLDQSAKTPLYSEYLGLDGTKKLLTANRLVLGKYTGLKSTVYSGKRLNVEDHNEEPTPENIGDSLSNLKTNEENWEVFSSSQFGDDWGYPQAFPSDEGYEDISSVYFDDNLRKDKKIQITPGNSYIEFQDDGGIKLIDAWGSYILLSHGNIEFHAVNNLFGVSGRDTLMFAGGNRTDFAKQDISVQAYQGSLKAVAGESVQICSEGTLTIEADSTLYVLADGTEITSTDVGIWCNSPYDDSEGSFTVYAKGSGCTIDLMSDQIRADAQYIGLTSEHQAFVLGGTSPLLVGDLDIRGGIWSRQAGVAITVPRLDTQNSSTRFYRAAPSTEWINAAGDVVVGRSIRINGDMVATGNAYAATVSASSGQSRLSSCEAASLRSACKIPDLPTNQPSALDLPLVDTEISEYFRFDSDDAKSLYRLANTMPTKNISTVTYKGFEDLTGDVSYIYPGESFWNKSGVLDIVSGKTSGFNNIPTAELN